ncbi:hypothetical protein K438DRAFT_1768581 [Mycena galopus ATCC 62051]|nr:hypothetical protein K438DRAFT_1768581 [Mycena galopus ATCC 62051]
MHTAICQNQLRWQAALLKFRSSVGLVRISLVFYCLTLHTLALGTDDSVGADHYNTASLSTGSPYRDEYAEVAALLAVCPGGSNCTARAASSATKHLRTHSVTAEKQHGVSCDAGDREQGLRASPDLSAHPANKIPARPGRDMLLVRVR